MQGKLQKPLILNRCFQLNHKCALEKLNVNLTMSHKMNQLWIRKRLSQVISIFYVLDRAINSLEERFSQLTTHNDIFGFMYNVKNEDKDTLLKKCADLQSALTDENHCDVEGLQLHQELLVLLSLLPDECATGPWDILAYITTNGLSENFPNVYIALRIALTLPVSVASGERSFSKMKLIKNYLRSTMSQERLVGLAM